MYRLIQNQPLSIITHDELEVCSVCICRDPALCLDFLNLLCVWDVSGHQPLGSGV